MRKILVLLFLFSNCSVNRLPQQCECTQEHAIEIADFAMRKAKGKDLSSYDKTIKDEEFFYVISYELIVDSTKIQTGGGGTIKISKETCKIIEQEFYQ